MKTILEYLQSGHLQHAANVEMNTIFDVLWYKMCDMMNFVYPSLNVIKEFKNTYHYSLKDVFKDYFEWDDEYNDAIKKLFKSENELYDFLDTNDEVLKKLAKEKLKQE